MYPSQLQTLETSIDAPKAIGFHIILDILGLLHLDSVHRSLVRCAAPRESAHVKVESV